MRQDLITGLTFIKVLKKNILVHIQILGMGQAK
jgi:hypothetical protein